MGFDDEARLPPVVVYDANLLYPFHLRNLFVQLGVDYLVSPRWTDTIHDESMRNLVADGRVSSERLLQTRELMQRALPGATVVGFEHRIDSLSLPDADDRHVLAAAIESGAEAIVTFNVKHFPNDALARFGIAARHPDEFLCALYAEDPEAVRAALEVARQNLSVTTPDEGSFITVLERQGLPRFVRELRAGR